MAKSLTVSKRRHVKGQQTQQQGLKGQAFKHRCGYSHAFINNPEAGTPAHGLTARQALTPGPSAGREALPTAGPRRQEREQGGSISSRSCIRQHPALPKHMHWVF